MGRIDVTKLPPVGSLVTEADLRHLRWILGITSDESDDAVLKDERAEV